MSSRSSDRWVTPGVIITALLVAGLIVSSIVGSIAYLTARGIDPSPLLKLAATLVGALGGVGTFVLQLAQRAQNSKTERNTGVLAGVVDELAATVPAAAAPAPLTQPAPYNVPAARHYSPDVDEHLADDDADSTRVAVPAIPPLPQSLRRRRTDQL